MHEIRFKYYICNEFRLNNFLFNGNLSSVSDRKDIIKILSKISEKYKLCIIGNNWIESYLGDSYKLLKSSIHGFIKYKDIQIWYKKSKIIIDHGNIHTTEFGSVNSRVFDSIASNRLVITNNIIGNKEIFKNNLDLYHNYDDIVKIYEKYKDRTNYENKVNQINKLYYNQNTYSNRADNLIKLLY